MGIGAALTSIVGQNIGANQFDRVMEAFKKIYHNSTIPFHSGNRIFNLEG